MQLRHLKAILPPTEGISKVTSITWSLNSRRLAVVTQDRIVHLFDENGDRKDKFSTKPADPGGPKNYCVRGMAFSPDSSKLAIGQSDNIVFVYKLGTEWGDKKSICNKFHQSSAITCVTWPHQQHHEIVFGLAEGKVKVGQLRSNKPATLYAHPEGSYVVSLTSSPDGRAIISGHLDGTIYRFYFDDGEMGPSHSKLGQHNCVPYALAWGESIVAAGNDCKVVFYDTEGGVLQHFDYSGDEAVREFTCAEFNPSGETVVIGSFNRYYVFSYNLQRQLWEESGVKIIDNLYTVTAFCWKPDGSRLGVGSLCGGVDMYDACIRRHRYKGKFEFTYVSNSQVIVKRLSSGTRIVLKSHFGYEITKINIYEDQYLIAHTPETLLMGDLESCKLSEVPWSGSGNERFFFDNHQVCMIYNAGELSLVEYGRNEVLGTCRTEHMSPFLISVRLNEGRHEISDDNKKIAFLIDVQTIRILDLNTGVTIATITHEARIDWLELNTRASHLLFRDKKRQLHLFNLAKMERTTMLHYCSYVQWVPQSDVVVAQNRGNLCVWYSIDNPERVTVFPIKGEVEDIERSKGRTEVVVDEGINTVSYALDESLIEFGTAVEDKDYEHAVDILEPLELTPETEALWQQLSTLALVDQKLNIAERCYAALGDVAKARFLHKINKQAEAVAKEMGGGDGLDHYSVRAKLDMLNKQYKLAENVLLENGKVEEAIAMYTEMHRWSEAVTVAEDKNYPEAENLRRHHYQWLIETGQEEQAGAVKEKEGDYMGAISLYLKGGLPGRAAQVVCKQGPHQFDNGLLDSISSSLTKAAMHERAGEFYEKLGRFDAARDAYRRGNAYRRAVDLCRKEFPAAVVQLEEEWGDWLVHQKQLDAAVNHFVEAGQSIKAIEAAIECRQWRKAADIVEQQDPATAAPFFKRIAHHYEQARSYEEAERYYVRAGMPGDAVEMYTCVDKWEAAHKVAVTYMTDQEAAILYTRRARELEGQGKFKEAEKMYLTVKEHDLAINMYKKNRMYDQMIRLVSTFRKDLLTETHLHLAQQLEADSNFKEAEKHYLEAKDWKSVVQMYRANELWDDAIRIARMHGGTNASKQVAYAWAVSLGGEAGAQLLSKFGLVEQAIDYAMESGAFMHAFELTRASMKHKLPEVHLKYAMYLEDEGRFKEAEEEFIKADKPKEAIDMYIHQQDWASAMRVAEQYDPASVSDVQMAQARLFIERKEHQKAEQMFVKAKRPELAIKMYKDARIWEEAIRVAEDYLPSKVQEIHLELAASMTGGGPGGAMTADNILARAKMLERSGEYSRAIDCYLEMTKEVTSDMDMLEDVWENASKMAMDHCRSRVQEVVQVVAHRLMEISRYEQAAELFESIDLHKEAVDVYVRGGKWDKARHVGQNHPQLSNYIEKQYEQHLIKNENADELATKGNTTAALDLYARQGEWEKVHELAVEQGSEAVAKFAYQHAKVEATKNNPRAAAQVFVRYGAPPNPEYFELYKHITHEILSEPCEPGAEQEVKDMLYKLVSVMQMTPEVQSAHLAEFTRLCEAAHFTAQKSKCKAENWLEMAAKSATALLRYVGDIPADKAFFEAGLACKEAGLMNMAFVFLNRYLDLSEAMEDPDSSNIIENSDFVNTDIPYDFVLPEKHYVSEEKREEVRDWVLALSMDQQGAEPPVYSRKEDWNKFIHKFQLCPWSNTAQNPSY
eukprot:gene6568-7868_t